MSALSNSVSTNLEMSARRGRAGRFVHSIRASFFQRYTAEPMIQAARVVCGPSSSPKMAVLTQARCVGSK